MPRYKEVPYDGPPKGYGDKASKLGLIVHSTESSGTARDEASYAKRRPDMTSSHYYVDKDGVIQSLDTDYGANHVGSWQGNSRYIAYEFCGRASWSRTKWLGSIDWKGAAEQMARDCATWKIPAHRLTVAELREMKRGVATHNDARLAWGNTDHTDPGPNFPMDHLMRLLTQALDGDTMDYTDQLSVSPGWIEKFKDDPGIADGKITFQTALVGGYFHSREDNRRGADIARELATVKAELAEIKALLQQRPVSS